jgi:outer membrane protein assembly factor BamD (BamD/ComL family)
MNKKSYKGSSSKYKGVAWHKRHKKWNAQIQINGKQKHLGYFTSEEEAALAYNKEAIKLFGEHALINEIETPQGQLTFRL